ncbi:MAG: hypothetical protein ABI634_03220 [Acidobacteriota bacterium]
MTRRVGLASLLVTLIALSGGMAAPQGALQSLRPFAAVVWSKNDRASVTVRRSRVPRAPRSERPAQSVSRDWPSILSIAVPLSRYQRPPPPLTSAK